VSNLVVQELEHRITDNPDLQFVQFKSTGVIRDREEALEEGHRLGADLVIWGHLQVAELVTSLQFAVLETPDKISNPSFPRVIPIFAQASTGLIEIPSRKSEEIAAKMTSLAAFTFGLAHFFKTDYRSAVLTLEEALQASPAESGSYLLHLYYGLSLQGVGRLDEAGEQFKQAALLAPDDPAAPLGLGFGFRSLGLREGAERQAQLAIEQCTKRITLRPDDAVAFYDRALAYEILEDWEAALDDYTAALFHDPDLFIANLSQIRMLIALGRISEAVEVSVHAVNFAEKHGANPAWAYFYQARAYQVDNKPSEANVAFQKAIELAPEVAWIHFRAARFYESVNELSAAHAEYVAMVEVSSTPASAHGELARFLARAGFPEAAIEEFKLALQIDPTVGGTWIALGDVYVEQGQTQEAQKAYERAVSVEPSNFYAWVAYGDFQYAAGDLEEAINSWKSAIVIDPGKCKVSLNMGTAYELLGKTKEAQDEYFRVLDLETDPSSECHIIAQERLNTLSAREPIDKTDGKREMKD
jgi:tetratricopeptide (TPR) repeat protein